MTDNAQRDRDRVLLLEAKVERLATEISAHDDVRKKVEKWENYGRITVWLLITVVGFITQADKVLTTLKKWLS